MNIKVIALDFDRTIIDIHTGGDWNSTYQDLVPHVRSEMKCLMDQSLSKGIHVAVASFSIQEDLIKQVIAEVIPLSSSSSSSFPSSSLPSSKVPTTVIVRGGENISEPDGKKKQLMQILHDISNGGEQRDAKVLAMSTILIDDDKHNIRRAVEDGYHALWFDPDHVDGFWNSIHLLR